MSAPKRLKLCCDPARHFNAVLRAQSRHFSAPPHARVLPLRPLPALKTAIAPASLQPHRPFSCSAPQQKKRSKPSDDDSSSDPSSSEAGPDPFDLTTLDSDLSAAITRLKTSLSGLRTGGRFNPAQLEALRVKPSKTSATTYPLSDLVQLVPKSGRELHLLVADVQHVKPVSSAILGAQDLNLAPQADPTGRNPLLLVVRIPPPTAETRRAAVDAAAKAGAVAADGVRAARAAQQKKYRAMGLAKTARPDDLKKAGTKMEEAVKKSTEEVKKIVEAAKKALDA